MNESPFTQVHKDFSQRQNSKAPTALHPTGTFNSEAALWFTVGKPLPFVDENNTADTKRPKFDGLSSLPFLRGERHYEETTLSVANERYGNESKETPSLR